MKKINIGRDFDSPIKIDEKSTSVSHDHASITIDDDGNWILEDHDSTCGTFIDDGGNFVRCSKVRIKPSTWIRLGQEGIKGHYFKARRVLRPNDFSEDFKEIYETDRELKENLSSLNMKKTILGFITPVATLLALALSMLATNNMTARIIITTPGVVFPFIQYFTLRAQENKIKRLQDMLICPKCRRTLSKDDIKSNSHSYCKAY